MYTFACLPVAIVDGERLGQTRSQMRMIAKKLDCYDIKNPMSCYQSDSIMDGWEGCLSASLGVVQLAGLLFQAAQQMEQNSSKFVSGEKAGPGDFCIASLWYNYVENELCKEEKRAELRVVFEAAPKVLHMVKSLREVQSFDDYLRERKSAAL